jgi:hypothetical protein
MFTSEETFRSILASRPIFVFDTNIYLDMLRYSKSASTNLLHLYQIITDDLRIPEQVHKELEKNIPIVSGQRISNLKEAGTTIKNAINTCSTNVRTQLDIFLRHKFSDASELSDTANSEFEKIKNAISDYIEKVVKDSNSFLVVSDVTGFFDSIWAVHTQESYKQSKLMSIYTDGSIRYRYKIPPGYMDDPQSNKNSQKDGTDIFGDLILWNQIIDIGNIEHRAIVFVTADIKEDWFILNGKRPVSPREELLNEFNERTDGLDICILTSDLFVQYFSNIKAIDTGEALLEMQIDDYVDITVRNNKDSVIRAFLSWGNEIEHILQFPFPEDINRLLKIDNLRYVIKGASLHLDDNIEYSVILEGVADFIGVYYDEVKKYNINREIQSAFQFDLCIAFSRQYERDARGKCIPSNDIENIRITNATLEAVPSIDVSLESRRGVFLLPTEDDKEIYEYMESIWDGYSENNPSVDKAEALVYFDAAEYFEKSLLEINRAYTLVQNNKTKSTLSLNEIDALAIKRFSDIKIRIENGIATYNGKSVLLGEAYPIPESMKLLPPEQNKELDVDFTVDAVFTDKKSIVCAGKTNLPPKTELMITLHSCDRNYHAQSKATVGENGQFNSEQFSDSKNPPKNEMLSGNYSIEIVVPIVSVQPDEVKTVLGSKGRNLSGAYVIEDSIFGKTIRYKKEFVI